MHACVIRCRYAPFISGDYSSGLQYFSIPRHCVPWALIGLSSSVPSVSLQRRQRVCSSTCRHRCSKAYPQSRLSRLRRLVANSAPYRQSAIVQSYRCGSEQGRREAFGRYRRPCGRQMETWPVSRAWMK